MANLNFTGDGVMRYKRECKKTLPRKVPRVSRGSGVEWKNQSYGSGLQYKTNVYGNGFCGDNDYPDYDGGEYDDDYAGYGDNEFFGGRKKAVNSNKPNYFSWARELLKSSGSKQTFGCFISQAKVKNLYKKTFGSPAKKAPAKKAPAKKAPAKKAPAKKVKIDETNEMSYIVPAGFKFPTNFLIKAIPKKKKKSE